MKNLTVNKAELISKIRTLEGLTNEEKADLIGLLRQHKKYGLVWEDKVENVEERLRDELPILREVKDKAIIAGVVQSDFKSDCSEYKDFQSDKRITNADTHGERIANPLEQAPNHILIEGDNLEALTALSYTHEGKIDVIYIDPPYNTGNKDFIYNDSYVDAEDGYRHSKWLSFMNKRLKIAKRLLSDKGVIFISIDDNEQAQLKLLCDEVFGNSNYTGQLIIKTATDNNPSQINTEHEYMLCYCSNKTLQNNWKRTSQAAKDIIEKYHELKKEKLAIPEIQKELRKWIKSNKDNLPQVAHYNNVDEKGVYSSSSNSSNPHPGGYMYDIIHPITAKPCPKPSNGWRWPLSTFKAYDSGGEIEWGVDESTQPHVKKRIETSTEYLRTLIYEDNRGTTLALADMFKGEKVFDNPKPLRVIAKILDFTSNINSTILDFFAGSGTTLHATMQLNAEDGGHRKCILVTNNENNICEEVTYERNKRVINGYTTPKGVEVAGLRANTLRYYKTDYISRDRTQKNMRALVAAATDMLCIKEDLYEEQKTFGRVKVNPRVMRYFSDGRKHMLVVYREEVVDMLVEEIKSLPLTGKSGFPKLKIYIFSPGRYAFDDNFYEVRDKVQLVALPAAIYDAYMKVLPKRREQMIDEEKKEETQMPQDLFEEAEKGGEV